MTTMYVPFQIRMRATGAGQLGGAPTALLPGEIAYNANDNTLYIGHDIGGANGNALAVLALAGSGAFVGLTGSQSISGVKTFSDACAFTGTGANSAVGVTQASSDDSTRLATTAYVKSVVAAAGGGTVTSVTATAPVASSGGNAPIISLNSGYGDTLNPYASKTANRVLAAPSGTNGVPSFRALVAADIPTLNQNTTGTAANVTGVVGFANGGSGQTTQQAAINALAGATTSGQYLRGNGTNVLMSAIQASDLPSGTGTGSLVYATSPSLTTPTLGVATATSINKVAITAPATSATLTIANGKTLTASNTLTFTGTDASSVAFGTGGTVAYTANKLNTFAATTSAELAGVISDETGTGSLVFSASPTFTGTINAGSLILSGDLTVNGTTTTINSTTVTVDDKNFVLGDVASPTDAGADGGGFTLRGTTDKTFNWVDATDAWTSSEHLNLASAKEYRINGTSVLSANTLGAGVTASSLTSVGTITTGTWAATAIGATRGGTGLTSAPQGSVLVANAANVYTALDGGGGANKILAYNATTDTVEWVTGINGGSY